ncbi:RHS repeat-associated core domain-containing protein [Paenibacillus xylanexedens]|uniref:RHS repeat-associated core domain-containing protein n=1 Tax=Paenibacillus xylanexedens TaxID=528191 RepID=UPI003D030D7E
MRVQYYDPKLKRFLNGDVIRGVMQDGQTFNRCAYVNGNPVSYIDPLGLMKRSLRKRVTLPTRISFLRNYWFLIIVKNAVKNNEFRGVYKSADEYIQGARDVMNSGRKVEYQYKGETRTGYLKFMGNSSKGEAKFEFVGTNANGNVTTYHLKRGEDLWKLLNNNKHDKTINPMK